MSIDQSSSTTTAENPLGASAAAFRLDNLHDLFPLGNPARDAHRDNSDNRSRHVSRVVFVRRRRAINCCRNRAFSTSSSARLRGRSANMPVTRFGRAGFVRRRKSWLAADERHAHRFLAYRVSWLTMSVYAPECRRFRGARSVYHAGLMQFPY